MNIIADFILKRLADYYNKRHPIADFDIAGKQRAALFDQRQDKEIVGKTFDIIRNHWNYSLQDRQKVLNQYEDNLDRIWNDKRTGTRFYNGKKFEPHQVTIIKNLVTNPGVSEMCAILAMQSNEFAKYYAGGTGVSDTNLGQQTLDNEITRKFVLGPGGYSLNSGNTWKIGCEFDSAIPNAKITEFAAFSKSDGGIMYARAVIKDPTQWLEHFSGITFPAASHTLMLRPV
jgi:hypothetical protein